jgi:hypothetical protein
MATTMPAKLTELSGEELVELIMLVGSADSVELKATLAPHEHRQAIRALKLDPLEAQIRQVFFLDTPDLRLNRAGVVVRARRVSGREGDTVVKLRPVVPGELPENVRRSPNVVVEVDAMPGGFVCSATMKSPQPNDRILKAVRGEGPVRKLFTKEQRAFYEAHAPDGIALEDLSVLGPTFVLKEVMRSEPEGRRYVFELWLLQDGTRIVELSTKCPPKKALSVAAESRAYLEGLGLTLAPDANTKTKTTLEFFAAELAGNP